MPLTSSSLGGESQCQTNLEGRKTAWKRYFILFLLLPPRVDHLDVVGRLTPSTNGNQELTAPRLLETGKAVALGRVRVLT
jgi:hypothetical protein